jgi:hypothetical protein
MLLFGYSIKLICDYMLFGSTTKGLWNFLFLWNHITQYVNWTRQWTNFDYIIEIKK